MSTSNQGLKNQQLQQPQRKIFYVSSMVLMGDYDLQEKKHTRLISLVRQQFLQSFELRGAKRGYLTEGQALVRHLLLVLLLLSAPIELLQAVWLTWESLFQAR